MISIDSLVELDRSATLFINSYHIPATDWFWATISGKEIWYVLYLIVLLFFFIRLGWKKALLAFGFCVIMVLACDQSANLVKHWVERVRPCNDADMLERGIHVLEKGGGFSFFSAHAANTFGFAVCSSRFFKWDKRFSYRGYTTSIFIWATFVSISRIFVACHFLGDVLVGTAAGLFLGFIIAIIGSALSRLAVFR